MAIYGLRFAPAQESLKHAAAGDLLPLAKMVVGMGTATVRKNLMQSYADVTGGVVYTHWKKHTLEEDLQRIAVDINSQYILAYVPSTLNEAGFHRLQIEILDTNLRGRTRSGYFIHASSASQTPNHFSHTSN